MAKIHELKINNFRGMKKAFYLTFGKYLGEIIDE